MLNDDALLAAAPKPDESFHLRGIGAQQLHGERAAFLKRRREVRLLRAHQHVHCRFCDEDPDDVMKVRWPAWCKARGIEDPYSNPFAKPGCFIIIPRCPLVSIPAEVENAIKHIRDLGAHPKLIAIDTAAKAIGGMDQDNARDAGILVGMTRFRREFGNAGWMTHHPKKSDASDMRGSGALTNDVDIVWQSIRSGQTLAVKLECMKMKSAPKPSPLHFQGKLYSVDGLLDQNGQSPPRLSTMWPPRWSASLCDHSKRSSRRSRSKYWRQSMPATSLVPCRSLSKALPTLYGLRDGDQRHSA